VDPAAAHDAATDIAASHHHEAAADHGSADHAAQHPG
jgi:hypothetical protein